CHRGVRLVLSVRFMGERSGGGLFVPHQVIHMTNDILEQVVEDYFREQGYFTQHNVLYRTKGKGTHSDIDVIAVNPLKKGSSRVVVISCKSWCVGINIDKTLENLRERPDKIISGKSTRKKFREIADRPWSKALIEKIYSLAGQRNFTFYVAATWFRDNDNREKWKKFPLFKRNLKGCKLELIDIRYMVENLLKKLTETPAHNENPRGLRLSFLKKLMATFINSINYPGAEPQGMTRGLA
ncbi:MAG: restriction endonuclease, partial [Patescibacteria group bacterium]